VKEVRIYHEVLEQAEHFIRPAIETHLKGEVRISLVRLSNIRPTGSVIAKRLADGLSIKDPDALLTFVDDNDVEHPLLVMEFSACVETQDHDLQRFDAMIAASKFKAPFVKVYAKRQSMRQHGGQRNYDRTVAYRILTHRHRIPAFEIDWPLEDPYTARRHELHRACPPLTQDFTDLVGVLLRLSRGADPLARAVFEHKEMLPKDLQRQLADHDSALAVPKLSAGSTRLFKSKDGIVLKFNRWAHAMDPERGMSWYYREILGSRLIGMLKEKSATTTAAALSNLCAATGLGRGTAISVPTAHPTDVSKAVANSSFNRAGLAIFYNCQRFQVVDASDKKLLDITWSSEPDLTKKISVAAKTALERRTRLTEDEVTYVAAYQVLRPNGFQILSVSYPGDQGDMPIVSGRGRTALRRYVDIIALKPKCALDVTESKGEYNLRDAEHAMNAILPMRDDPAQKALLIEVAARRAKLSGEPVVASIAFADSLVSTRPSRLDELDFFISMTPTAWKIWTHRTDLDLPVRSGATSLPETWSY
jgi:hypothetical protein